MKIAPQPLRKSLPVKSAVRVLEVLELFARVRRPLSLKEVIAQLNYPQSSATFLMKSITTMGYLNYDRKARTYFPTFKVAGLGDWLRNPPQSEIKRLLKSIQVDTGETIILAVQNDLYLQYVEVLESTHEMRFHVEKGSMIPLTRTSLGWILLSAKPAPEVERICRQINARSAPSMQIDIPAFQIQLEGIRRAGYCYVPNLPMQGGGCISLLLPKGAREQPTAIGAGGLVERLDANKGTVLRSMRKHLAALKRVRQK
jgi:DNA-binding IclR family transcriptional regulator